MADPKISSLEELKQSLQKQEQGEVLTLPSGLVFRVKRPSISKLIKDKAIPGDLMAAAVRLVSGNNATNTKELGEGIALMENIISQSIVEPVGITVEDIANFSDEDKAFLYFYIQKGVKDLEKFRSEQREQTARLTGEKIPQPQTK